LYLEIRITTRLFCLIHTQNPSVPGICGGNDPIDPPSGDGFGKKREDPWPGAVAPGPYCDEAVR